MADKKKKHILPYEKITNRMQIILGVVLALFLIVSVITDSEKIYSGKVEGVVSDVFYVSDRSGRWYERCEVTYKIEGKEYVIRTDCPGMTCIGDSCEVKYNSRRPRNAFVDW